MKTLYIILILVFAWIGAADAQKKPSLITSSRQSETQLSQANKNKLEKLRGLDYLNSVSMIAIGKIEALMDETEISIEIPGKNKNITSRKVLAQGTSNTEFLWVGESEEGQIILSSPTEK